ncbi:DUF805 domain-containing protein [Methylobacterium sp. W2]|uniref:DUF805 domain-containing protein n=1 Tax=Methylobacterium sp. W2 TaxID=2598107 RepID=UPI001D0C2E6A|nr:DUF805 domain-containing protein [Methylobacterium sp. W2]MCC0805106.1 DUF805 domain-containing protein [Methylobacterium sp. W2]
MKGKVLAVAGAGAPGVISGEDGRRYSFAITDMRTSHPYVGQEVDFQAEGDLARDVYAIGGGGQQTVQQPQRDWVKFYFSPTGRLGRSDYWLYGFLVILVASLLLGWIPVFGQILSLVFLWSGIALNIKRFHDVGYSGWWNFIAVPPSLLAVIAAAANPRDPTLAVVLGVVAVVAALWAFFAILIARGETGPNRFGPDPRDEAAN